MEAILYSNDQSSKLTLEVLGWEFADRDKGIDSNWLNFNIKFENKTFTANILNKPSFMIGEIEKMSKQIGQILEQTQGEIEFSFLEPYINLRVILQKSGKAIVNGKIKDIDYQCGELHFEFNSDQSCLKIFNEGLINIISYTQQ